MPPRVGAIFAAGSAVLLFGSCGAQDDGGGAAVTCSVSEIGVLVGDDARAIEDVLLVEFFRPHESGIGDSPVEGVAGVTDSDGLATTARLRLTTPVPLDVADDLYLSVLQKNPKVELVEYRCVSGEAVLAG